MKLFAVWFFAIVFLIVLWTLGGGANDRTVGVSALICGVTSLVFWQLRQPLTNRVRTWRKTRTKFIVLGGIGALWVEFVFWAFEKVFNASGVAASPNLLLDWLGTMPWYLMMTFLLWYVVTKYHYSLLELVLLGGVYELGVDGIFASFAKRTLLSPNTLLLPFIIPLFVIVYSPIILLPNLTLKQEIAAFHVERLQPKISNFRRYGYAMLPWLGLTPYFIIFSLTMI